MNIKIFSFTVFLFQFNLNNTDGVATNKITPITITSIDKIINTFINYSYLKLDINSSFCLKIFNL